MVLRIAFFQYSIIGNNFSMLYHIIATGSATVQTWLLLQIDLGSNVIDAKNNF